jgi:hypothetical protein
VLIIVPVLTGAPAVVYSQIVPFPLLATKISEPEIVIPSGKLNPVTSVPEFTGAPEVVYS